MLCTRARYIWDEQIDFLWFRTACQDWLLLLTWLSRSEEQINIDQRKLNNYKYMGYDASCKTLW